MVFAIRFKEVKYKQLKNSVHVAEKTLLKALKALMEQGKIVKRPDGKDAYYKVHYQAYMQKQQTEHLTYA